MEMSVIGQSLKGFSRGYRNTEDDIIGVTGTAINSGFTSRLAAHVAEAWSRNKRAKLDRERIMLKSLRQIDGKYDADKLAMIKMTEGSEINIRPSYIKFAAAKAWLAEAYSPARGRACGLQATPIPELSEEKKKEIVNKVLDQMYVAATQYQQETGVQITPEEFNAAAQAHHEELKEEELKAVNKEAKNGVEKMSSLIDDQKAEGDWDKSFRDVRSDIIAFGTGILKAPVVRRKRVLKWEQNVPVLSDELGIYYERVSPLDVYPSDDAVDIDDGDFIEYMAMTMPELSECIDVKGYNSENIRKVLNDNKNGHNRSTRTIDQEKATAEGRMGHLFESNKFGIINFWGKVKGDLLLEWGMDESQVDDEDKYYEINAWFVEGSPYVIRAVINHVGMRPYSKEVFVEVPGSFWGNSLPETVSDTEDMVNSTVRAIQNNQAFCALPMSQIDRSKMLDGPDSFKLYGGRVFVYDSSDGMSSDRDPVKFYQPESRMGDLLGVYNTFTRSMDEKSGIPAFAHGDPNIQGAGNTASGLSMFVNMAGKFINELVIRIDANMVARAILLTYIHNMIYSEDPYIKRDAKVIVNGINALVVKEQEELRKAELFRDTNNPVDLQIMGIGGRTELLRDRANGIRSLNIDKVLPETPIQFFPLPQQSGGQVPIAKPPTLDVAGNLSGGVQNNAMSDRGTA